MPDPPPSAPPASRPAAAPPGTEVFGVPLTRLELERTALLFGLLFLAALLLVVGRSARDALFLTRFPVSWIAPMWIAYGVTSSIAALAWARYVDRLARAEFAVAFAVFAAVTYAVLRLLIGEDIRAAYLVFYVGAEIIANFGAVLVWAIAQDLHDPRSAKRLFGLIGAGRVVGTLVSGLATGGLVTLVGTENLLLVLIVTLLAMAALVRVLVARHPLPARPPGDRGQAVDVRLAGAPGARRPATWRSRYALTVVLFTLLLFAVLTIGDYQFKAIARTAHPDRDDLARFMGFFYAGTGALGLIVQLAVTPRLLQRHGVPGGMLVMPAAFAASTAALLALPSLLWAAIVKASDNGLQFTIHEATMQMLLFPFPPALRERARTIVSGVAKPLGYALGALILLVVAPAAQTAPPGPALLAQAARLGFVSLPLALVTVALIPWIRRGYFDAMRRTLIRREIDTAAVVYGPQTRAILREALHGDDSPQVLFAIDQLRVLDPDLVREWLPALTRHRSARVRATAVRAAAELRYEGGAELARAAIADKSAPVRVAGVEALASLLREDAHDVIAALADHEDEAIRAAAIAALVRSCGLDGMLDGAPRLRALLDSPDPRDRIAAARVLGMVGHATLQRALARLIGDAQPAVRRAAIRAASTVADVRLLPLLADALADRALAPPASQAIAALGDAAIPELAVRLGDPTRPRAARLVIPRVLARARSPEALTVLLEHIDEPDEEVRQKALASASRLRLALRAPPAPLELVRARFDAEVAEHVRVRDAFLAVRPRVSGELLDQHVLRRLRKGLVRVLRLCELAYPREVVALVRTHVFGADPALRANAFEVLESLLDRPRQRRFVDLVERYLALRGGGLEAAAPARAEAGSTFGAPGRLTAPSAPIPQVIAWIRGEIAQGDPYRAALALDAVAQRAIARAGEDALAATRDPDPLVREAAAIAVAVTRPEGFAARLQALLRDEDAAVTRFAQYWAATGRTGIEPNDTMYTTIEKILFLQRVPVFSRVAGDDLVGLARGSIVVALQKGDVIFRQGEPGGALYSIISGAVVLRMDGREIARLGPNDVFGEMSIFDSEPRSSTAVVAEDAELLRVSAEDFHEAVRETVEVAEAVIQVLNRRLRDADRRLAETRARLSIAARITTPEPPPASEVPSYAAAEKGVDEGDVD